MPKDTPDDGSVAPSRLRARLNETSAAEWEERGRAHALGLFKDMARRVPAYGRFLAAHGIDATCCENLIDLERIPAVDKDTYLKRNSLTDLSWNGAFPMGNWTISATSGSTGEPFHFPRQATQDEQYADTAEQYLLANFKIDQRRTLYIVTFPMGVWIGGVFTYSAITRVAERGYDITILTPGLHKPSIIAAIKQLAPHYDQVIIGAYAPFLRDIIEDGSRAGVDWRAVPLRFVHSAEAFPESFRDFIAGQVGLANIYADTLNHYGTVDLGTMAHETPLSVMIRRRLVTLGKLDAIFPEQHRQPTLCQYDPTVFYFEHRQSAGHPERTLHCSANAGLPLFRYDLKDHGGVIGYDEMHAKLKLAGIDMERELASLGLSDTLLKLPFVFVYERADFCVGYYAFFVYPDPIRRALLADDLPTQVTGLFKLESTYANDRPLLRVHIELCGGIEPSPELERRLAEVAHQALMRESAEYPEVIAHSGDVARPRVVLHARGSKLFVLNGKHSTIMKAKNQ